MADKRPGRSSDQFPLRLPDGMRDEIKRLADENGRSMNSEIVARLNFALENSGLDIDQLFENMADLLNRNSQLSSLFKEERSLAVTLLSHVLAYADRIPPELIIWIDTMLDILEKKAAKDIHSDDILQMDPQEREQRVQVAKLRYSQWAEAKLEKIMKRRELSITEDDIHDETAPD